MIRSPLGALSAVIVLVQSISAGALFAVRSDPLLLKVLASVIAFTTLLITALVVGIIVYFTRKAPGLLFNPQDIAPSVHKELYAPAKVDLVVIQPPASEKAPE